MTFVSIVGTQVMAVLNPLLALTADGQKPERVILMKTSHKVSQDLAESLKKFLIGPEFPFQPAYREDQVDIRTIAVTARDGDPTPTCEMVLKEVVSTGKVLLNIAGGMNFQIAAMLTAAPAHAVHFIYPEMTGVQLYNLAEDGIRLSTLPLPGAVDVLRLQGITLQKGSGAISELLAQISKVCRLQIPAKARKGVLVGDLEFDLLWNSGNEIRLVYCLSRIAPTQENSGTPGHTRGADGENRCRTADEIRDTCRRLIAFACNRSSLGELFHRSVTVISDHPRAISRLRREGQRKIIPLRWHNTASGKSMMKDFWSQTGGVTTSPANRVTALSAPTAPEQWLITPLGKDIVPTLIAVYTHRPDTLILPYTPGVAEIEGYRQALTDNTWLLPVRRLHFVPVRFNGSDLLDNLPAVPQGVTAEVNLTPGTKVQTALLTWWALRQNATLFTIDNIRGEARQVGGNTSYRCAAPSPIDLLTLSGHRIARNDRVTHSGNTLVDGLWLDDTGKPLEALAAVFLAASREKSLQDNLLKSHVMTPNGACSAIHAGKFSVTTPAGNCYPIIQTKDQWFEDLLALQLYRCGADEVQLRLEPRWSQKEEQLDQINYQNTKPQTEIDVVARFGTNYVVVSCKSGKNGSKVAITTEAVAYAALFGRFAMPVVAYLRHFGKPRRHAITGVWEMGPATFADVDLLKEAVQMFFRESQTTTP